MSTGKPETLQLNIAVRPLSVTWCHGDDGADGRMEREMVVVKLITKMTIVLMTMMMLKRMTMVAPTCLCGAMEAERGEVTSSTCSTMYWFTWRWWW